jgi:hypothetical protein
MKRQKRGPIQKKEKRAKIEKNACVWCPQEKGDPNSYWVVKTWGHHLNFFLTTASLSLAYGPAWS